MNFELEAKDIEAIAGRVIEKLVPLIRELQKPDRVMDILEVSALAKARPNLPVVNL